MNFKKTEIVLRSGQVRLTLFPEEPDAYQEEEGRKEGHSWHSLEAPRLLAHFVAPSNRVTSECQGRQTLPRLRPLQNATPLMSYTEPYIGLWLLPNPSTLNKYSPRCPIVH